MMIATLCATLALAQTPQTPTQAQPATTPKYTMHMYQLVFLTDGPKKGGTAASEKASVQAEHLKYLESLWSSGKAVAVGPLMNGGTYRGIVILDVPKPEDVQGLIEKDPWVQRGEMSFERYSWYCAKEVWQKGPKFMDITSYRFGLLSAVKGAPVLPKEESAEMQKGHMANISSMANAGALIAAGPIADSPVNRGIFIFKEMPVEEIEKLVAIDPLLKNNRLKLNLMQWFTAKGNLVPLK